MTYSDWKFNVESGNEVICAYTNMSTGNRRMVDLNPKLWGFEK